MDLVLYVVGGDQSWLLDPGARYSVGRSSSAGPAPEIDLRGDRQASRAHAEIWFERNSWWLADRGSKHGTRLAKRTLSAHRPYPLEAGVDIFAGNHWLAVASPHWWRCREGDLEVEVGVPLSVSLARIHSGIAIVEHLSARSFSQCGSHRLNIRFGSLAAASASIPPLTAGESVTLDLEEVRIDIDELERRVERAEVTVEVALDGRQLSGVPPRCICLAANEWEFYAEQRALLASFVQPNHPLVNEIAASAVRRSTVRPSAESCLRAIFEHLRDEWELLYRTEPPSFHSRSQKIRLPHEVLTNHSSRTGGGTCIDIAALIAGCLENLGLSPIVAVVEIPDGLHSLIGCRHEGGVGLEVLPTEIGELIDDCCWIDPNGCTLDPSQRATFERSKSHAARVLTESGFLFALDVAAARQDGIVPIPAAGQPRLAPVVATAAQYARRIAEETQVQLGTIPLLVALITVGEGAARDLFAQVGVSPDSAAKTMIDGLKALPPATGVSRHFHETLALAHHHAKRLEEIRIEERHVLSALFSTGSGALRAALRAVGTTLDAVREQVEDSIIDDVSDFPGRLP